MAGILITGADGFTAAHIARRLIAGGHEVHGLGRTAFDLPGLASRHRIDIRDADRTVAVVRSCRPSHVLHLAGIAFAGHVPAADFYGVNVVGTRNLLEACLAGGGMDGIILASTAAFYADHGALPIAEDAPIMPRSDYAISKLAMEMVASLYADRLPIILTRPFNYTGRGQSEDFLVSKIVAHARRGASSIPLGNLDVVRDISDIRMVAEAYARLLFLPVAGGMRVFNICSGRGISPREILALVAALTGRPLEAVCDSRFVRASDIAVVLGDNSALLAATGPLPAFDMADTVRWMIEG